MEDVNVIVAEPPNVLLSVDTSKFVDVETVMLPGYVRFKPLRL